MSVQPTTSTRLSRLSLLVAPAAAVALVLSGCSGGSSGSTAAASASGAVASARSDVAGSGSKVADSGVAVGAASPAESTAVGRKLAKQASLWVQVTQLTRAAATVRSTAVSLHGVVLTEQLGDGSTPPTPMPVMTGADGSSASPDLSSIKGAYAALTLSVPADRLDDAVAQLGRLGKVLSQSASTQDVTTTFVDTQSRLKTMQASVDRVRALMNRAKDVAQVVTLETQLSKRQADLESLQAQLASVQDSVAQSTVSVTLTTPETVAAPPITATGFGSGLSAGWHAFTRSVTAVLTAIGAVLPFAAVLALLAAPLVWWQRRANRRSVRPSSGESAPAA